MQQKKSTRNPRKDNPLTPMRIAFMFCGSLTAAWSVSDGIAMELERAGHQVLWMPRGRPGATPATLEILNGADLIIVSGPEHIFGPQISSNGARRESEYSFGENEITMYEWRHSLKVPKLFWYHESNRREDRTFGFEDFLSYGDYHFFPAIQDAETYDQAHFSAGRSFWLQFGVDTHVFKPTPCTECFRDDMWRIPLEAKGHCPKCLGSRIVENVKTIPSGFIGMLYPKRIGFVNAFATRMKQGRDPAFCIGRVQIMDIEGTPYLETAERVAMNYRKIGVFVNLPHYSELMVTKVYEVMACGTLILTPMLEGPSERNLEPFKHCQHLVYYKPSNLPFLVQTIREFHEREEQREKIALAGMVEVREKHSLKVRVEEMFRLAKVPKEKVSA